MKMKLPPPFKTTSMTPNKVIWVTVDEDCPIDIYLDHACAKKDAAEHGFQVFKYVRAPRRKRSR